MKVFTTNWYLYKTHFHQKSQTQRSRTETNVHGSNEENDTAIRDWRANIKQ